MDLTITILLVVTIVVTKDLPISPRFTPYDFLSRYKVSTITTRQPMVEFYFLTFPRFPLRKKEHKSYFGKNRTHEFRTSRCAGCLLDHSGMYCNIPINRGVVHQGIVVYSTIEGWCTLERWYSLEGCKIYQGCMVL